MRSLLLGAFVVCALCLPGAAGAAGYAPIECAKATTPADKAICKSYSLGQAEARMATLYGIATSLVAMGQRGAIMDDQVAWLKVREACGGNITCLSNAYATRIAQLGKVIDDIAAHGPY